HTSPRRRAPLRPAAAADAGGVPPLGDRRQRLAAEHLLRRLPEELGLVLADRASIDLVCERPVGTGRAAALGELLLLPLQAARGVVARLLGHGAHDAREELPVV